jgi:hypothetical protein
MIKKAYFELKPADRDNPEAIAKTIQRNWQHRVHKTKKNKRKTHYLLDIAICKM